MKFIYIGIGGAMFLYSFTEIFGTLAGIAALGLCIAVIGSIFLPQ